MYSRPAASIPEHYSGSLFAEREAQEPVAPLSAESIETPQESVESSQFASAPAGFAEKASRQEEAVASAISDNRTQETEEDPAAPVGAIPTGRNEETGGFLTSAWRKVRGIFGKGRFETSDLLLILIGLLLLEEEEDEETGLLLLLLYFLG